MVPAPKFGQILLLDRLITQEQLDRALEYQKQHGGRLGEILSRLGYLSDADLTRSLGNRYGVPTVDLHRMQLDPEILALIPAAMARARRLVPISRLESTITCAMEDPTRVDIINEVEFQTGYRMQPVLVTPAMMDAALERGYSAAGTRPSADEAAAPSTPTAELSRRIDLLPPRKRAALLAYLDQLEARP